MSRTPMTTAVMAQRHSAIDSLDYFPTPPWATRAFMREFLKPLVGILYGNTMIDPACGEGHMVHVLREFTDGSDVIGSDVHDYGKFFAVASYVGEGPDVLPPQNVDWVITNPPFNRAVEFVQRALKEARLGVAVLVRTAWLEGGDRYRDLFEHNPPSWIVQYADRVPMVAGRWDPKARTATAYCWVVWTVLPFRSVEFAWIKPGAKDRNTLQTDFERWKT